MVALHDINAAIHEARRAVEELGFVGVMMPTNFRDQDIGKRQFWPFYEEIERLGVGLGLHGGVRAAERMHGRFDTFIASHSIAFPFECMAALTGLIFAGVPEAFPRLQIAALEACCGWVPFLMDRLDEEFEVRGSREAATLKRKPSEYMTNGQFFCAFELEESTLPYVEAPLVGSHAWSCGCCSLLLRVNRLCRRLIFPAATLHWRYLRLHCSYRRAPTSGKRQHSSLIYLHRWTANLADVNAGDIRMAIVAGASPIRAAASPSDVRFVGA